MSLRARLLLTFGVLAIAVLGTSFATVRTVRNQLIEQVDSQLSSASAFERFDDHGRGRKPGPGDSDGDGQSTPFPDEDRSYSAGFNSLYVGELVDGEIVRVASPDISGESSPDPDLDAAMVAERAADSKRSHYFTVDAVGDSSLRYRIDIREDPSSQRVYVIGAPLDAVDTSTSMIKRTTLALAALTIGLLGLAAWWLTRLGLRPIRQMTTAAEGIAAGSLSQRVPEAPAGTEAGHLGAALNGMLGRLEDSFEERARTEDRLRQFAADASHELRTPVQTIRGYGELFRMGALDDDERLVDAMRRTEQEATRMGRIIDDLLLLARLDQQRPLDRAPVDLVGLGRDAAADAGAVQPARSVSFAGPDALIVEGDEMRLRQVIGNLVANALTHTPLDSAVRIAMSAEPGGAVVSIGDNGPGMDAEAAGQAFERFYRSDRSRSRVNGGSGLGLSIVRGIVEEHGGSVSLESDEKRGTTVTLHLPFVAQPGSSGAGHTSTFTM